MTPPKRKLVTVRRAGTTQRSQGKLIQRTGSLPLELQSAVLGPRADSLREVLGSAPDEVADLGQDPVGRIKEAEGVHGLFRLLPPGSSTPANTVVPDASEKAVIGIRPTLTGDRLRQTFAHEMGHYVSQVDPNSPIGETLQMLPPMRPDPKKAAPVTYTLDRTTAQNIGSPRPRYDAYSAESPEERRAQALANAFAYLQETASDTANWRGRIGAREGTVPGTGSVARVMLQSPVYEKHPLRSQIR